ncbi:hypothetical protein [Salinibaculum salinum]|uniref:hypothetical protein n=1 Tax=Salinibaculum salinum TaxID=3131996 RepID=UPI0030EF5C9F
MSDSPIQTHRTKPETIDGPRQSRPAGASVNVRHTWGLATYYRLRSIALEARVRTLEDELEQKEQQLQSTIRRYEDLLQQPDEDWVVVTNHPPEMESTTDD